MNKFETGLSRDAANFVPLTPVGFLRRAAAVFPDKTAVIHGDATYSYRTFYERCRRLASALEQRGIGKGDTVSVIAPNVPALLEAHYACPMIGAVLNAINVRLDARSVAFILEHGESKLVITDRSLSGTVGPALKALGRHIAVIDIDDPLDRSGELLGDVDYEGLLAGGDPGFDWRLPDDEWEALALSYTSGTTGDPKGVVYHHRGAYMNALGNAITFGLGPDSVYLWTLPMFHCCGWSYTWAVTAVGGTHVCLRRVDPALIFPMIRDHGVTHMCGAPIVLTMLIHAPDEQKVAFPQTVEIATGGAAPPTAVIAEMERMGFRVTHLYGMTESYGPSTVCVWQPGWDEMAVERRAALMARQGVNLVTLEDQRVADPETMQDVPADGQTIGMLMLRGNTVMKGYLKNEPATQEAFEGGWLHTGDLAVKYPDGYIEIKDRAKDIILSGGENISSIEVEEVLFRHPDVMEAAVVSAPHDKWGETPCAFVTLKPGSEGTVSGADVIAHCRDNMAHFKAPTMVRFGPLPKTATGKIQKFVLRERAKEEGP
jgi:fatty-acyl-CoA synthase